MGQNPRVCCYNERDAARVSADLKRADGVRFDLQKSVFDGVGLESGVREEGVDTGCVVKGVQVFA